MKTVQAQDVVNTVRHRLSLVHPGGTTLSVIDQGVRLDQEWWYVPVRPDTVPPRRYEYYEALGQVERQLLTEDGLIVLFMPVAPE